MVFLRARFKRPLKWLRKSLTPPHHHPRALRANTENNVFSNPLINQIANFLVDIGIDVVPTTLDNQCFLPGIQVKDGKLLVDESKLTYPGDLLHEAGHLAVAPATIRNTLSGEVIIPGADVDSIEVQVTAWAFAAVRHLDIDPKVLFHGGGYKGKSAEFDFHL